MTQYAELATTTNFSFLYGASHPAEYVARAAELGYSAIGIADRNTLAGVVRAHIQAKSLGLKLLIGARLIPQDGPEIICYPTDRDAYGRLSTLISLGKSRTEKGDCIITVADIEAYGEGQIFLILPPGQRDETFQTQLEHFGRIWPGRCYLAAHYPYSGRNYEYLARLEQSGRAAGTPMVAINDVLYHVPDRRPLQDIVTCIREHCTIDTAGYRLTANAERHLKTPTEMARLFTGFAPALSRLQDIVEKCNFSLDELAYEYPDEPVPANRTPQQHLNHLTWTGAAWRYPDGVPDKVAATLRKELALIAALNYAPYFLTVYDIVAWARQQHILCQGRGSAANSAVCFCLGITSVDPKTTSLLFERFLSKERREPPDIDVDFEHERREEVIQYVYQRYGRDRAALTATVISYRSRSAIREVCKALGLSEEISSALAKTVWGSQSTPLNHKHLKQAGLDPDSPALRQAMQLGQQLIGFPRHLSQHVGGFVLTRHALTGTVPIGPAAMADRTFIEWDKDDLSALSIMKVDVLALGMLSCIRKSFNLLAQHKSIAHTLASLPPDDTPTYDMLCRGDSLGVFQVESRAQMNMLPRLRPRTFYDLVIEVALVRPGPIQGDMVHPYLRRRQGKETVRYPSPAPEHGPADELERILKRTLGVPLFQEQAMQISIDAARFTPDEANGLRRAMATFRKVGTILNYEDMMVSRMIARGYDPVFAKRCFDQVKGFGEYGFPESHAASFALLVYVSSWLKCHHPDVFCAALLNSQPMGFYAPAQIVRDAQEHGVEVRPVDVNMSEWDCTLEPCDNGLCAVRLGFRQIDGLRADEIDALIRARRNGYGHPEDIRRRAGISRHSLEFLAAADAFGSLDIDRRDALWAVRGESSGKTLPLFARMDTAEQGPDNITLLPPMPASEHVLQDYQTTRLSLKNHPIRFLRSYYQDYGIQTTQAAISQPNGQRVQTAGIVLIRQKPGSANGVFFITLEDETGIANLVVWPRIATLYRSVLMGARIMLVNGRVQTADNVTHIVVDQLIDRTGDLQLLSETAQINHLKESDPHTGHDQTTLPQTGATPINAPEHAAESVSLPQPMEDLRKHPRNVRIIPKSRDFH